MLVNKDKRQCVCVLGWSLFLKSDLNFMDIKYCALFTELGRIVESLVFYMGKSTPRPTHLGGKTMDLEVFFNVYSFCIIFCQQSS